MPDTPLSPAEREAIYRRNFAWFLADNVFFNLAQNIISPTTVIPDFVRHLTRSEVLIGAASSLLDVGGMLPQLFVARYLARVRHAKRWFVIPTIPSRLFILAFGVLLATTLGAAGPETTLIAFFLCLGAAALLNGLVNVPWAVMAATSLDGRWRTRVFGLTAAIVGVCMLGLSPLIGFALEAGPPFPGNYALLFGAAGVLLALSVFAVPMVRELPNDHAAERVAPLSEFLPATARILRDDSAFRAIVTVRLLTMLFAMAAPFYIGFATERLGLSSTVAVPALLATQTVGSLSGALLYTWVGARHNVRYMRLMLACAVLLPLSALLAGATGPLALVLGFLVAGLTITHLFDSFYNWVITHAPPENRATYSGLYNTIGAISTLVAPLLGGLIVQAAGYETLFVTALVMVLGALAVALRWVREGRGG